MNIVNTQKNYDEIDIISYLSTLKRNVRSILFITIALTCVTFLVSLTFFEKTYQGEILISIGSVHGELIETPEQLSDAIALPDTSISLSQGKGGQELLITIKENTSDEAEKKIQTLAKEIKTRHADIIKKKLIPLDARVSYLKANLQNIQNRIDALQGKIDHFNSLEYLQVLSAQTYVQSYDRALERKFLLEDELQKIQSQEGEYKDTKIEKRGIESASSHTKLAVNTFIAFILGLIIALFYVLIKEWWKTNKHLLR